MINQLKALRASLVTERDRMADRAHSAFMAMRSTGDASHCDHIYYAARRDQLNSTIRMIEAEIRVARMFPVSNLPTDFVEQ